MCLHDTAHGDVRVAVSGKTLKLRTGQQLVVSSDTIFSSKAPHPIQNVAIRNSRSSSLESGHTVNLSDFSMVSALANLTTVRQLQRSSILRERRLFEKIVKNASILEHLNSSSKEFFLYPENEQLMVMNQAN